MITYLGKVHQMSIRRVRVRYGNVRDTCSSADVLKGYMVREIWEPLAYSKQTQWSLTNNLSNTLFLKCMSLD